MSGVTRGGFTPSPARAVPHQVSVPSPGWEVHLCPAERVAEPGSDVLVADFSVIVFGPDRRRVPELCRYGMTEHATAKATARESWQFIAERERPDES